LADFRQIIEEGRRYEAAGSYDRALQRYRAAADAAADPSSRSEAVRRQSDVFRARSELDQALSAAEEAEQIAVEHSLNDLIAEALNAQGAVNHSRGDFPVAEDFYSRALAVATDPRVRGIALTNLGTVAALRGDLDRASRHFKEGYECCRESQYERGELFALMNYARVTLDQGKADAAEQLLREAEVLAINMMDLDTSHMAALNRAEAMLVRGAYDDAETLVSAALGYYGSTGNSLRRLDALRLLGDITKLRGSEDQARMFYEAAGDLAERIQAGFEIRMIRERIEGLGGATPQKTDADRTQGPADAANR
jgi:tetratricopeptide (TPR) repeat protein